MFLALAYLAILFGSWYLCRRFRVRSDTTKNLLLVTAHPDDELMFFGPTLFDELRARYRAKSSSSVHILCLSNGNFYGDGNVRVAELNDACQFLLRCIYGSDKQPEDALKVTVIEDTHLPDSPTLDWQPEHIYGHVSDYIAKHNISKVVTFDGYGVSGHTNHIAIDRALQHLEPSVELWQLESVSLLRKYLSMFDMVFVLVEACLRRNWHVNIVSMFNFFFLVQALRQHQSQMLWFRYLYSSTSRYMFINTLRRRRGRV